MMQAVSCSGLTVYFDRNSGIRSSGTTVHFRKNKHYSIFQFQEDVIRFMTSPRLEKYQKVLEWDAGYLVVIAKYKDLAEMEEYIDLVPILEDLSYDVDSFLSHIKEVKIREATR